VAGIELRLYGAAHLRSGEDVLHVGARKALALLAVLAVDGVCSREKLAALLWPQVGSPAGLRNLRNELFRLRSFGAVPLPVPERCLALPTGLRVDAVEFQRALDEGRLAAALALASATAFDGLDGVAGEAFDDWLEAARAQLGRRRRQARSALAAQLEGAGNVDAALAWHEQAFSEDGCDETSARELMRLLVARGDRAAAAAVLARLTARLHHELALAPGPQTLALAAALPPAPQPATARPALPEPPSLPAALLPERLPFVARSAERARVARAWADGRRVYLAGVAGIGKTRLAEVCAADRGAWLRVACQPADSGQPYASALRVLRALHAAGEVALPPWVQRELGWLMPEVGDGPPPVAGVEAGERLRAAFATAWALLVADNFHAIVLDDWHWVDDASAALWPRVDLPGVAVMVAYRSAQLPAAALAGLRAEADGCRARVIEIDEFSLAQTQAFVRAAGLPPPWADGAFARRLHAGTAGNPFFLIETLQHLALQGQAAGDAALPVPPSVRSAVLGRVVALGDATRRLLEAASLLGERFDARLLEGTSGDDAATVEHCLEHARAARLLTIEGAQYRFVHDLIWHSLGAGLSPARRRLLHARLAQRLEAVGAAPGLVAVHLEGAGEGRAAVDWRLRAAAAAWRVHAHAETRRHCRCAIDDGASPHQAVQAQMLLAEVERYSGDAAALAAALQGAVDAARTADVSTWLQARLAQLQHWMLAGRAAEVPAALDALAPELACAGALLRARAAALRAALADDAGRMDEARRHEDEAIALLDGLPQLQAERAGLLDGAARIALMAHDFARAGGLAARAIAAAEGSGDDALHARTQVAHGLALLWGRNDRSAAAAAFERARALAQRCGHVPQQRAAIMNLVKLHADAGRTEAMLGLLDEAQALAPGFEHPGRALKFREARYFVHYLRGDVPAARAAAAELVEAARAIDDLRARTSALQLVVDLYLHSGDLAAAERLLDAAGDGADLGLKTLLAAKRAWLELARGDAAAALARIDGCVAPPRNEDALVIAWVGAAAALALGDPAGARRRLQGVDIAAEHTVDALAMVLVQRLLLARHAGGDDTAARERALEVLPRTPGLEAGLLRQALG
jgi:DNA-binding SARP family transcriptional activator